MESPRTTIIVTQRERFSEYQASLATLYDTKEKFELIYVDMESPQAIKEQLERDADEKGFSIIKLDRNVCQNVARNIALKHVNTEFVVFADNDIFMSSGWLEQLIDCFDSEGAGIVGPLIMEGNADAGIIHFLFGNAHIEETTKGKYFARSHPFVRQPRSSVPPELFTRRETETLEFHCLMARKSVFDKVGDLDEKLMSIGDHDDLCMIARRKGEKIYAEPSVVARYDYSVPLLWCDMFYFFLRWSPNWVRTSIRQFADKQDLAANDPYRSSIFKWVMKHHGDLQLPPMSNRLIEFFVKTAYEIATEIHSHLPVKKINMTFYSAAAKRADLTTVAEPVR